MATVVCAACADGNLTSASTWAICDQSSTAGLSFLDTEGSSGVAIGSTPAYSGNFSWTSGAPTIDGIGLKLASRAASVSGTITVILRDVTGSSNVKTVTIDAADLSAQSYGWTFFKFDSSTALSNSNNYAVGISASTTQPITILKRTSDNDFAKYLRTTTTGAPAADDVMIVCGEFTAAGAMTTRTVTMNSTATTSYGVVAVTTYLQHISVGQGGYWNNGTTASTDYNFTWKGIFQVSGGGTLNIGSSGTRFTSSSTASYNAAATASGNTGIVYNIGAVVNIYGTTKNEQTLLTESIGGICSTSGTTVTRHTGLSFTGLSGTLTINSVGYTIASVTDADHLELTGSPGSQTYKNYIHSTANVVKVVSTSGWVAGDTLAFAGTGQSVSEGESATISNVDSATQVTLSTSLTKPHIVDGYDVVAEVINLTRNVKFFGTSSYGGYSVSESSAVVNIHDVEHYYWGYNATGKKGMTIRSTTGSCNFLHNSIYNSNFTGNISVDVLGSSSNNILIEYNVLYNVTVGMSLATSSNATHCHNNCLITCAGNGITSGNLIHEISYNRIANAATNGLNYSNPAGVTIGLCDNNICHSCSSGLTINAVYAQGNITNCKAYNNVGNGFNFTSAIQNIKISDSKTFGNASKNLLFTSAAGHVLLDNVTLGGWIGSGSAGSGVYMENVCFDVRSKNCSFGVTSGSIVGQVTSDFYFTGLNYGKWVDDNSYFGSSTLITGPTRIYSMFPGDPSMLSFERFNRTAGSHKTYTSEGLIEIDTTEYYGASGESTRMTPNANATTSNRMKSYEFKCAVASGNTVTPTLYLKKNASYDGSQPRLYVKQNYALGITADTLLATYASGTGSWNSLGGVATASVTDDGTLSFYVDCDYNTGGYINIDTVNIP